MAHNSRTLEVEAEVGGGIIVRPVVHPALDSFKVDLHHLHVREAVSAVTQIVDARPRPAPIVILVTGRGRHSTDGRARLYPALVKLCRRRGLRAEGDEARGQVVVAL